LLAFSLGDVLALARDPHLEMSDSEQADYDTMISRRAEREPVSHITGVRSFFGRDFAVSADVLDPRPETEVLIERALQAPPPANLLDLGTGSGAIALTLLAEWPDTKGVATDLSPKALEVAARNAVRLGLKDRVEFVLSDWMTALTGTFDLVVSNPPYITAEEMTRLSPEVLHEPHMALSPGTDGLGAYRTLSVGLRGVLRPNGRALFEIGATQGNVVSDIFAHAGWSHTTLHNDMDGRPRVLEVQS
jgi:release factor glutamine methyltransferase